MIECSNENIWYKKKNKKNRKRLIALIIIVITLISVFMYYKFIISKQLSIICSEYAYAYSTEAVNSAVMKSLNESNTYQSLITIEKNNLGDIVLMSADSKKINKINKEVATLSEIILKEKLYNGIPIPFMAFSGLKLLSGYGKPINFKAISVSAVYCSFSSDFKSVGINQTLHSIYIEVLTTVSINIPFENTKTNYNNRILICETVLIGKVPEIYLNGKLFNN